MGLQFEWDRDKATKNLKKHNIGFDEASTVFDDPMAYIFDDEAHSDHEHREIIIGHSVIKRLLLVCFTERAEDLIRIFSARLASKKECKDYEENTGL
jgi:uncharacterized protein